MIFVDSSFWIGYGMAADTRHALRIREAFAFDGDFTAAGFVELRPA